VSDIHNVKQKRGHMEVEKEVRKQRVTEPEPLPGPLPGPKASNDYGECCGYCGRRQPVAWQAPDDLYRSLTEGYISCPRCFTRLARSRGIRLTWRPLAEPTPHTMSGGLSMVENLPSTPTDLREQVKAALASPPFSPAVASRADQITDALLAVLRERIEALPTETRYLESGAETFRDRVLALFEEQA
jgi:hypothetical protein